MLRCRLSTDQFHLDAETSDKDKRRREQHFHTIEIPRLRLIGFSMVTALVLLREAFVLSGVRATRDWTLAPWWMPSYQTK
jgi:hypothetical protein